MQKNIDEKFPYLGLLRLDVKSRGRVGD